MKVTYFRLKGYINILNGMGLEEIVIPFNIFKNRIVLVSGVNGTGKSTLISALSPNPDTSDSYRTDVFIDDNGNRQIIEYPAEKEICYQNINEDGNVDQYRVLIQSLVDDSRTRRTTKAYISKNGEEFNPNGNVQSFKDIRDSLLGIDPVYLDLSSISAENRGLVDMIPSERRKYMASYIGSLDTYNNIFKIISKKVTGLKSYMNTLNSKIYEIGDEGELRLKQMQLETSLKDLNRERDKLLKDLAEAEATVRIVDPDNKMQDLYVSISERLQSINLEITKNSTKLVKLYEAIGLSDQNINLSKILEDTQISLAEHEKTYNSNKERIRTLVSLNESTQSNLDTDNTRLLELSSIKVQSNIESAVSSIQDNVDMYSKYLEGMDNLSILEKVTLDELMDLRETLTNFVEEVKVIEELGNDEEFKSAVTIINNQETINSIPKYIQNTRDIILNNEIEIASLTNEMESISKDLEELKVFETMRPGECVIDTCPYIAKYVEMKKNNKSEEKLKEISDKINSLRKQNKNASNDIKVNDMILLMAQRLTTSISLINNRKNSIKKIKNLKVLLNITELQQKLIGHYRFNNEFNSISDLIENYSIYEDLKKAKQQLKDLESDLKVYQNNKKMIDSLTESINRSTKEYSDRELEIKKLGADCNFLEGLIGELKDKVSVLEELISEETNKANLINEKQQLKNEFESVKDKIKLVKDKLDSVNTIKNDISRVEESIAPLSETINNIKYNLVNIVNYQQEYKDTADKYEKMIFIRNACSPGNGLGIQSEYIKRYMNDIIIDCNKMLSYMFDGNIQLDVPVINEKQFSIPFIGPGGIPVPDISNGSTAQKCMMGLVFSCIAMMKSSLKYNIPRFDEIDGGLDQQNRITFITVLNQVLDFMNSEQCIICSHNVEFDNQSTTRILCSPGGIRIEQ